MTMPDVLQFKKDLKFLRKAISGHLYSRSSYNLEYQRQLILL